MFLVWHGSGLLQAEQSSFHVGDVRHGLDTRNRGENKPDLISSQTNQSRWNARQPLHTLAFLILFSFFPNYLTEHSIHLKLLNPTGKGWRGLCAGKGLELH